MTGEGRVGRQREEILSLKSLSVVSGQKLRQFLLVFYEKGRPRKQWLEKVKSINFSVIRAWNKLPELARKTTDLSEFRLLVNMHDLMHDG